VKYPGVVRRENRKRHVVCSLLIPSFLIEPAEYPIFN
jgi:hypothetical protein